MKYDFETIKPRYGCGSAKWNEVEETIGRNEEIVPFSVADMEFQTFPKIKDGLCDFINSTILGYSNPTAKYKNIVKEWQSKMHNWNINIDWILPSHGVVDAFFSSVRCYTKEGEGVILLTPVYYPMYEAIEHNNRKIISSSLKIVDGRYEIDFDDFRLKCEDENNTLFILCSPHNPSGRIWTEKELKKLGDICNENGVLVVSDEIHNDLIMPGNKHITYASLGYEYENNSIILTSASKSFNIAGLQTSNVIIPNMSLREKYYKQLKQTTSNPKCNILGYKATEIAYEFGEDWLRECIGVIYNNYKLIKEFMNKNYPEIKIFDLQSTYLLWMDFTDLGFNYKELETINKQANLFFDEGYVFGREGECYERWNLAVPTYIIENALKRFKVTYDQHLRK